MNRLLKLFPDLRSVLEVFAWSAFLCFGWTLLASFWRVPSWLFYLTIGELFSLYAYAFVVAFLESIAISGVALGIGLVLPKRWWNDAFSVHGSILVIVFLVSIMLRLYMVRIPDEWEQFLYHQWKWWGGTVVVLIVLQLVFSRVQGLRRVFQSFTERVVTFLYLYMPLTVLSIIIVFLRNI